MTVVRSVPRLVSCLVLLVLRNNPYYALSMGGRFVWDEKKAASNWLKHSVSFEEAQSIFSDPLADYLIDPEPSEARFVVIGRSSQGKVLYVVHIELEGETIRIISARKVTRHEQARYEER